MFWILMVSIYILTVYRIKHQTKRRQQHDANGPRWHADGHHRSRAITIRDNLITMLIETVGV